MTSTLWTQAFVPDGLAMLFSPWGGAGARLSLLALVIAPVVVLIILLVQRKFRAAGIFAMVALFVVFILLASVRMYVHAPVQQSPTGWAPTPSAAATRSSGPSIEVEAAFVPPAPRPGVPTIVAPDDFTPWKSAQALVAEQAPAPGKEWAWNGAGARYVRASVGNLECIMWEPGADNTLPAYSGLAASPADAEREAGEAAARKVGVLALRVALPKLAAGPSPFSPARLDAQSMLDMRAIAAKLARELRSFQVKDSVPQEIVRPYGNVYCRAVLVSVEPARIEMLAQRVADRLEKGYLGEQSSARFFAFAAAGLTVFLVALFAAYCLMRAGSTGAFAWPLRTTALLVLAILGAAVYLLGTRGA